MRRGRIALLAICLALGVAVSAWSHWEASSTAGGNGAAVAATVDPGATPTATAAGAQGVTVTWAASLLSDGQAVTGYRIKRYDAGSGVLQTVLASCTGVVSATTCRENSVPAGSWKYTVTPVIGTNWQGAESLKSGAVTSAPSTFTLGQTLFGLPLPKNVTGTLTGFGASEGVTYRLDGATTLTGSPSSVNSGGAATITSLMIPSVADGAHTVWVDGSDGSNASVGIVIDTTAPTAGATPTPTPNGAGWNNTTPVSVALSANDGTGSGIASITYTTDGTDPTTSGTAVVYSTAVSVAATTTIKYFATDAAGNASGVQSQPVKIDAVAPANAITLSNITGGAFKNGSAVYYRGTNVGSFTLTNAVTDGSSGPASSTTAALTGSTGWTHTPSVASTPAGGPYVSNGFSWAALTTSSPGETVTGSDTAGNTTATALTFTNDITGPAGGAVDAIGLVGTGSRYSTSTSLSIGRTAVTDAGAGVATGASLWRASASLAGGVCGAYTAYSTQIGSTDPTFPVADTVAANTCYSYEYRTFDLVGNQSNRNSPDIKIDTSAPAAPTFAFSAFANTYWSGSGSTVYYRSNAATGSFTATATAVDAVSGVASYALPNLGANWTTPSGTTGVQTYAWSATPAAPTGSQNATASNNASLTSPTGGFTMVSDITAPTTGTVTYTNGYATAGSVSVAFTPGTDIGGSGVDANSDVIQRAAAPLSGAGTCGTYGGFGAVAGGTNPTTPFVDSTVSNRTCYQYRHLLSDNVGNQVITTSASVVKVDYAQVVKATSGLKGYWRLGESTLSSDSGAGTAAATLQSRAGEIGSTWTKHALSTNDAVISDAGRIRKNGGTPGALYYTSAVPASANYRVEADIYPKSFLANDMAGVVGRMDSTSASGTFYMVRWEESSTGGAGSWNLWKAVNGAWGSPLKTANQTLTANTTYRLALDMNGTTLRVLVDGVDVMTPTTDAGIAAVGRGGILLGDDTATGANVTNTTGLHVDNFNIAPPMLDSTAAALNTGDYSRGPTLGAAGALPSDADTAAAFGLPTYGSALDSASLDVGDALTLEAWVKRADSTSSATMKTIAAKGTGSFQWGFVNNKMGLYKSGVLIAQTTSTQSDLSYHHYVATKNGAAVKLYVDGIDVTGTITNATLNNTASTDLFVGVRNATTNPLNGTVDELALYDSALSAATVQDHYALGGGTDFAGPTGGSVDATGLVGTGGRYSTSTALSIALAKGTDPAGLAATGAQLRRSTATLTNGACGSYDVSIQIGGNDPTTPVANAVPSAPACYRYEYVVADTLGNLTTYLSGDIKIDATAPAAPTFAFSALTNAYWTGSGSSVFYRPAAGSGSFTATATAVDADSGIASYAMPNLGTGWTVPSGTTGAQTYGWLAPNPAAPSGAQNATATNNAQTSTAAGFTLVGDSTAPAGGSVSYTGTTYASPSVPVTFTTGTDTGGSGIGTTSGVLQRQSATLTGANCGSYTGGFTTVTGGTNPSSPFTDTMVLGGNCYQYRYQISDNVGNTQTYTNANVAKVSPTYQPSIAGTSGLVNYWRLGEDPPVASDSFSDATATLLSSHAGELGATWAAQLGASTMVISNEDRGRKSGTGYIYYTASATPASANYSVEADVHVKSSVTNDRVGVVGRFDGVLGNWYEASYDRVTGQWQIREAVSAGLGILGTPFAQTLTVGQTYRLRLELIGPALRLYVDGALRISTTDASLSAANKGGVFTGTSPATSTITDTTGLHLDEFRMMAPPIAAAAVDSIAADSGAYTSGTMSLSRDSGALSGDPDTALSFDGVDDYVSATRQIQDDLSIEFWFKSTQGRGFLSDANWNAGAGMVDASLSGTNNDFGVSLSSDGYLFAGTGGGSGGDVSVVSTAGGYNDGTWHHVVFTRVRASGVLKLYVDGAATGAPVTSTNLGSLTSQATINFGRSASAVNYYRGSLDEVATYNVVLTPTQVSAHYAAR